MASSEDSVRYKTQPLTLNVDSDDDGNTWYLLGIYYVPNMMIHALCVFIYLILIIYQVGHICILRL